MRVENVLIERISVIDLIHNRIAQKGLITRAKVL